MANPYVGEIKVFAGNFAPQGWAFCNGQLVAISQNTALFSLLGTTYGGDGQQTFGLPDLRGRALIHQGQGNGLSPYAMGQMGGVEAVTLITQQLPGHTHAMLGSSAAATSPYPNNGVGMGATATGEPIYAPGPGATPLSPQAVTSAGGGLPHDNRQPYLAISYIIALFGIFPTRN